MQLCTLRFPANFLLLSAFHLKDEGLASRSKALRLGFFLCLFSVDSVVINAKLIENKLLSKLRRSGVCSSLQCLCLSDSLNVTWSRNHRVVVMTASVSVVLVKGGQRGRGKGNILTNPLSVGLCELVTQ